jgi:hypothetical protein
MQRKVPDLDQIKPDTPLRLDVAAAVAYPDGSMTASGLRKENARGRLVIERTAGKDYTTLAEIRKMRELCRVSRGGLGSGCEKPAETRPAELPTKPCGSSSTEAASRAQSAARRIVAELKRSCNSTSTPSTRKRQKASVTPIKSS